MHHFAYIKKLFFFSKPADGPTFLGIYFVWLCRCLRLTGRQKKYRSLTTDVKEANTLVAVAGKSIDKMPMTLIKCDIDNNEDNDEWWNEPNEIEIQPKRRNDTHKKSNIFESIFFLDPHVECALYACVCLFLFLRKMSGFLLFIIFVYLMFDLGFTAEMVVVHREMSKLWSPRCLPIWMCELDGSWVIR